MKRPWSGADGANGRELRNQGLLGPDPVDCALRTPLQPELHVVGVSTIRHELLPAAVVIVVAATIVILPMLVLGTVSGRDFPFHLASWMDVARQWHHGTIYPQWAELANWGLGEPRFVFYPPASWMLGADLGSLLAWKAAPIAFVWLVLIAAGISMFVLARDAMPWRGAALAA